MHLWADGLIDCIIYPAVRKASSRRQNGKDNSGNLPKAALFLIPNAHFAESSERGLDLPDTSGLWEFREPSGAGGGGNSDDLESPRPLQRGQPLPKHTLLPCRVLSQCR